MRRCDMNASDLSLLNTTSGSIDGAAAEDWLSGELAEALDRPMARRIFAQG